MASWVSADIDLTVPSPARVYDYALGGGHNFAVDREMYDKLLTVIPNFRQEALRNRAFLRRAVLTLVDAGVRQFLDIGSGIPTAGNVHEIAQRVAPESRVVYVDVDPVAVAHSELLLENNDRATAIRADMRDPAGILDYPQTRQTLDFDAPIGLLMVTVFHYVSDSDGPMDLMARYRDRLAPGSYLVLSHVTADFNPAGQAAAMELWRTMSPGYPRTRAEIIKLFTGFDLLDPGLVTTSEWRPHPTADGGGNSGYDDNMFNLFAGVGIKR